MSSTPSGLRPDNNLNPPLKRGAIDGLSPPGLGGLNNQKSQYQIQNT